MTHDYSSLRGQLAADLSAAATSASLASGGKNKKVKLQQSDLPSLIPSGSSLFLEPAALAKLQMGDVICVSVGQGPQVRRFVRLKMTPNDTFLITAYEGFSKKEALPKSSLVGKVTEVEFGGKTYSPTDKENPIKKFFGKLTEYGTHKPFGLG